MSLSSTKETHRINAKDELKVYITGFTSTPKEEEIPDYIEAYCEKITQIVFNNVLAWFEANKKAVKTDTKPAEPHFHLEAESATSGLKFD